MNKTAVFSDKKAKTNGKKESSHTKKADFSRPMESNTNHILFLQRTIGNQVVEGMIRSGKMIQRYSVPSTLSCANIVDWLNTNSPYSPDWAQTSCNYSFNGNLKLTGRRTSNGYEITVRGHNRLAVSVNCPIDRPQWSPSNRLNRNAEAAAWRRMRASLDAHEQQHRQIGQRWRTILENRFRAVNFTVTGTDEDDAREKAREQVNALKEEWLSDAQDAQDAIDPFRGATLSCP